jgi:hypothetical protein
MSFWAVVWPFISSIGVGAIALKMYPDLVSKYLMESVEQRNRLALEKLKSLMAQENAAQMERLKRELEATTATLQNSLDFLSAGQAGMRSHFIEAAQTLWSHIVSLRDFAGGIITIDAVLRVNELDELMQTQKNSMSLAYFDKYKDRNKVAQAMISPGRPSEEARLFVGDQLWQAYYVSRAAYMRLCILAQTSLEERKYNDWRQDSLFISLVETNISKELIVEAANNNAKGVRSLFERLDFVFLKEAMRLMTGSQAVADHLSNLHSALNVAAADGREQARKFSSP